MALSTQRDLEGLRIERNPFFIRLRQNTLRLAAGMNGEVNRAEAHQSEPTSRRSGAMSRRKGGGGLAMAQFRSFILLTAPMGRPYSCIPDMGKPPFKASEGGLFDIFYVTGGFRIW